MSFRHWKNRVSAVIRSVCGFDPDDLTDFAYREAWNAGRGPVSVAHEVLAANGYIG